MSKIIGPFLTAVLAGLFVITNGFCFLDLFEESNEATGIGKQISINKMGTLMPFIGNRGQMDPKVAFCARTFGANIFITKDGKMIYSLPALDNEKQMGWSIREYLVGCKTFSPKGEGKSSAKISSFKGNDKTGWASDIPLFNRVKMGEVYDGIEMELVAYGNNVEKLFYVNGGANPEDIEIRIDGSRGFEINNEGQLEVYTDPGSIVFTKPVAYQKVEDRVEYVDVEYNMNAEGYGFTVGEYDRDRTLIIDPLLASTFLGGSANEGNVLSVSMVLDDEGHVYVSGRTLSPDFPYVPGAISDENSGNYDVFVSMLSDDLSTLIASTYFGGYNIDGERGSPDIILDGSGNLYLTCTTTSSDLPITEGAYRETLIGNRDIFISRLSGDLSTVLASTFFGSPGFDQVNSIALDGSGNVFIAGYTRNNSFPTTDGAFQRTYYGTGGMTWGGEVFISKFSADLSNLLASTYLGGSDWDEGGYLAIDDDNDVYVVGSTRSGTVGSTQPFPTTSGSFSPEYQGDYMYGGDAFVSKLSNDLTALIASTYLGGNNNDWGYAIVLDDYGNVYVTGHTPSSDFPSTPGAYDEDYNSVYGTDVGNDMYASKFSPDLSTLIASTFLGTQLHDVALEIKLDAEGNVYIGGHTNTTLFQEVTTPGCYDDDFNGGSFNFGGDIAIACFNPDLSNLISATYLGGSGQEDVGSFAFDADGNLYIAGFTNSSDFPVIDGAYQDEYHGGSVDTFGGDVFVSIIPREYFTDSDGDGVADPGDNCPEMPNSEQDDVDEDGIGDFCDGCPDDYNPLQEDSDADGIQDACDNCPEHYNPGQEDSNDNDVGDVCDYICGDSDGDRIINILDIVHLINCLYKSGPSPDPLESADVNHDLAVNILDIVYLINFIYKNGPEPECMVW